MGDQNTATQLGSLPEIWMKIRTCLFAGRGSADGTPSNRSMSLSNLLHSVWQSLSPSMLLQMALFHSFNGWVIFHPIYVPHLLYPFLYQWTLRLLPCLGYCKQYCNEHWGAFIISSHMFFSEYMPKRGIAGSYSIFFDGVRTPHCVSFLIGQ